MRREGMEDKVRDEEAKSSSRGIKRERGRGKGQRMEGGIMLEGEEKESPLVSVVYLSNTS